MEVDIAGSLATGSGEQEADGGPAWPAEALLHECGRGRRVWAALYGSCNMLVWWSLRHGGVTGPGHDRHCAVGIDAVWSDFACVKRIRRHRGGALAPPRTSGFGRFGEVGSGARAPPLRRRIRVNRESTHFSHYHIFDRSMPMLPDSELPTRGQRTHSSLGASLQHLNRLERERQLRGLLLGLRWWLQWLWWLQGLLLTHERRRARGGRDLRCHRVLVRVPLDTPRPAIWNKDRPDGRCQLARVSPGPLRHIAAAPARQSAPSERRRSCMNHHERYLDRSRAYWAAGYAKCNLAMAHRSAPPRNGYCESAPRTSTVAVVTVSEHGAGLSGSPAEGKSAHQHGLRRRSFLSGVPFDAVPDGGGGGS